MIWPLIKAETSFTPYFYNSKLNQLLLTLSGSGNYDMPLILQVDAMQALAVKYSHDSAYQRVDGGNAAYCYLKDNREISLF